MGEHIKDYSFQNKLIIATGIAANTEVGDILRENLPDVESIEKAQFQDDKMGVDYWVYRKALPPLGIDCKIRDIDPIQSENKDDLALETWSIVGRKIGWTADPQKRCDFILWFFRPTKRWVLLPFPMLQVVFIANKDRWYKEYKHSRQSTNKGQWQSECIFVSRIAIWRAIYERFGGAVQAVSLPMAEKGD